MNEVEVVKRAKQGDQKAFSELVNAYSERIYNLGLRILRKKEDAEDILQETFLTVIQKIDTFDGRSSFFTWIYRIATNVALMKLRKKKPQYVDLPDNPDRTHTSPCSKLSYELPDTPSRYSIFGPELEQYVSFDSVDI